ncbi:MAG: hypothetical protein HY558_06035, partial [Euryarchaeota archaeon]|nr:hypothetical protein [Euryarchaeota archaeon]
LRLFPLLPPETHTLPPGGYWNASFPGVQGQEILPAAVRIRGSVDLLVLTPEEFPAYTLAVSRGTGPIAYDPNLSQLNLTREQGSWRLPRAGTYIVVLDNTPLPPGGAPGREEAQVFLTLTTPGVGPASDALLIPVFSIVLQAMFLGGAAYAAGVIQLHRGRFSEEEMRRGLLRGLLGIPAFGGSHALLTYLLLAQIGSPERAIGGALLGLVEGLFAPGAGLAYPLLRRRLPGGPLVQGLLLLTAGWAVFAVAPPLLLGGVPWDPTTLLFLENELVSFLLLGAVLGWRWEPHTGEKPPPRQRLW